jgi:hypothetical protein
VVKLSIDNNQSTNKKTSKKSQKTIKGRFNGHTSQSNLEAIFSSLGESHVSEYGLFELVALRQQTTARGPLMLQKINAKSPNKKINKSQIQQNSEFEFKIHDVIRSIQL